MKINLLLSIILFFCFLPLVAQQEPVIQDPAAGKILDRVAAKAKVMKSIQADFSILVEDKKENTKNTSTGNLLMKKEKYKISTRGSVVYFDGKTMWTHSIDDNEVIISEPGNNKEDFMSNPANIFTLYNRDFKYRYIRETTLNGLKYDEIDLYPKSLDQPYSRIKLLVNRNNDMPGVITSYGKDGVNYIITLTNFQPDREISDTLFTFDPAKNKKVEVVDMRGTK
jgi:outer membrane lipoprotein carrier protein